MEWKARYQRAKENILKDRGICVSNRTLFGRFFEYEEYKLKRKNGLASLDTGCFKTLTAYVSRLRTVNQWFGNKPWKDLTRSDIKAVYDGLEDGTIRNRFGKPIKDKRSFYNQVIRSKPFELAGKLDLVIEVMEFVALPPELEREFVTLDFALPDKDALGVVMDNIGRAANLPAPEAEERELLLDAATGLTTLEAENAFALSIIEAKELNAAIIAREKAHEVKKSGLLEVCQHVPDLDAVGGLDQLKSWLLERSHAFGEKAKTYGLPSPKGLLIVGIPGTGKSLTAKATAAVFNRPLLKLDAGKLFGSLVGQSEANLRNALATAEAIAPCVLWIDELEKGFAGARSSGSTDGGTSSRVFGSLLNWMQDRTSPVFVVATANDVMQLSARLGPLQE